MDIIEADHIQPRIQGGSEKLENLQALHKHCHIQKSRIDSAVSSLDDDFDVSQISEK
jgi:RNA-directed DNA polymerase